MNRRLLIPITLASLSLALAGVAWAQPALDRVEEQLRKQAAPCAGDPPADDQQTAGNSPGYLGILADDRGENGKGVRVTEAVAGGPAAKGGMKVGDLITAIDGQTIAKVEDMTGQLQGRPAGVVIQFRVLRDGKTRDLEVRLERRPPPENRRLPQFGKQPEDMPVPGSARADAGGAAGSAAPGPMNDSLILSTRRPKLGVRTVSLTPFIREQNRLPGSYVAGVYVTYVDPDAPAGKAGLPATSIITSVDGEPMDSPDTLASLVHRAGPGQTLNIAYYFRDHESVVPVTLGGGPPTPAVANPAPAATPRATVRARPPVAALDQPPGFEPDEQPGDDTAATIEALKGRIADLEKRVAELEAAAVKNLPAEGEK